MGKVVSGSTEFCTFGSCPETWSLAAIVFHGTLLQSSSIFFFKLLIGFYLVNLADHVEMINISLM